MEEKIYIDEKGRKWYEYYDKNYTVETEDGDYLSGIATVMRKPGMLSTGFSYLYVDKEHNIEAHSLGLTSDVARKYFEETIECKLGKLKWLN